MEELKPCPFCGSKAQLRVDKFVDFHREYSVYCMGEDCGIEIPHDEPIYADSSMEFITAKKAVVDAWNKRFSQIKQER